MSVATPPSAVVLPPTADRKALEKYIRDRAAAAVKECEQTIRDAETLTCDALFDVQYRAGRIHGPWLLYVAWFFHKITDDVLAAALGATWSLAEFPEQALGRKQWIEMFRSVGLTYNGQRCEPPADPVRLYRGAPKRRRRRLAWTSDRSIAERFAAGGVRGREPGSVWMTDAPPPSIPVRDRRPWRVRAHHRHNVAQDHSGAATDELEQKRRAAASVDGLTADEVDEIQAQREARISTDQ